MPLPIIILVERHWDKAPKKALMNALPFLTTSGYDTLCFESPYEKNEQETIDAVESTIEFIETRLAEANQCLAQRGMLYNLPEMDYIDLQRLLQNYVSSKYYKEMALWFKELPGHKEKLLMVRKAVESSMKICGIDLASEQLESINGLEAQTNLMSRVSGICELDKIRAMAFKRNMLELQQQGKGVVFVVGQSHYMDLIEEFSKEYPLSEIIFLHPYSSKCLDKSYVDYNLPSSTSIEDLILIEKTIYDDQDIEIFLTYLRNTVQPRLDNYVSIEPTSTCQLLSDKTGLNFEAYVRPGYLVDCHHFFSDKERMGDTVAKLNDKGVRGFFSFFKGKPSYCVPNINIKEVASQIQKMDL